MAIIESIMKEFTENNEIMKNNEVVTESTVAIDNKSSAIVAVSLDTSRSYGGDIAYFKFKPNADVDWKHCARISFRSPKYVDHYGKSYRLSRNEKKRLLSMLQSPSCIDKNITGWEAAINNFNDIIRGKVDDKYILPLDLPIPDYMKL